MPRFEEHPRFAADEELEITGHFFLEKKDGSLNTSQIDPLKWAFGWDGRGETVDQGEAHRHR